MDEPVCICPLCKEPLSYDERCAMVSAEVAYGRPVHGTRVAVHVECSRYSYAHFPDGRVERIGQQPRGPSPDRAFVP